MIDTTSANAPFDTLRPMLCRASRKDAPGLKCNRNLGEINWDVPTIHDTKCPKCGAQNIVYIPERAVAPLETR